MLDVLTIGILFAELLCKLALCHAQNAQRVNSKQLVVLRDKLLRHRFRMLVLTQLEQRMSRVVFGDSKMCSVLRYDRLDFPKGIQHAFRVAMLRLVEHTFHPQRRLVAGRQRTFGA